MHFSELALNKLILKAVFEKNYETPTEVQRKTIPLVLEGKDVIASAQTGTGKTGAFALPILQKLFADREAIKKTRGRAKRSRRQARSDTKCCGDTILWLTLSIIIFYILNQL